MARRYRAAAVTKTRVVHKFFDELEVEVRAGLAAVSVGQQDEDQNSWRMGGARNPLPKRPPCP